MSPRPGHPPAPAERKSPESPPRGRKQNLGRSGRRGAGKRAGAWQTPPPYGAGSATPTGEPGHAHRELGHAFTRKTTPPDYLKPRPSLRRSVLRRPRHKPRPSEPHSHAPFAQRRPRNASTKPAATKPHPSRDANHAHFRTFPRPRLRAASHASHVTHPPVACFRIALPLGHLATPLEARPRLRSLNHAPPCRPIKPRPSPPRSAPGTPRPAPRTAGPAFEGGATPTSHSQAPPLGRLAALL